MIARLLVTKFGIQPSEVAKMTLPMVQSLVDTTGEIVTLRDAKALERFFSGG
jgi:hypothetical protein